MVAHRTIVDVLKLWLIERIDGLPYDQFLAAVVCAATEDEARDTLPDRVATWGDNWIRRENRHRLRVTCIGTAALDIEAGPVLAHYLNA